MGILWKIQLLGGLRVERMATLAAESFAAPQAGSTPSTVIERFRTQKTGALLAYLALHPQAHAREVLCDMLWPEAEPTAGAQSLRTALSSLRRQLEPPGVPDGAVLIASRTTLQLNAQVVKTDACEFKSACKAARAKSESASDAEKIALLETALNFYSGALLPGFYEDWILSAAREFEEEFFALWQQLLTHLETVSEHSRALHWARIGEHHDQTRPEVQAALQRLNNKNLAASGQTPNARVGIDSKKESPKISSRTVKPKRSRDEFVRRSTPDRRAPKPYVPLETAPTFNDAPVVLPAILDRFFGRENEINRVCEELNARHSRLFAIIGAGGSGKTRLAIEAAHQFVNAHWQSEQAIFYVPLADVPSEKFLIGAVLEVLSLPRAGQFLTGVSPEAAPFERLVAALSARPTLLVLDNFEHLTTGGAPLLKSLLECAPSLQMLVTSQQRLAVPGGREIVVGGLPFPAFEKRLGETKTPEELWQFPAIQMFVERAQSAGPDFGLTRHNAAAIEEICRRLEGVPLALELAAARASSFTPTQIASRLADVQEKSQLLQSTKRPATLRHFSLHTAITWSFELLPKELANLWTNLSVFRGGFTLEAAQAVCEDSSAPHRLGQLRACSLVNVAEIRGTLRFRLPELLREYAEEKERETNAATSGVLPTSGELRLRHARYYDALLENYARAVRTGSEGEALALAIGETENARAALEWAASQHCNEHHALAASLSLSLGICLQRYGLHGEAQVIVEKGLEIFERAANAKQSTKQNATQTELRFLLLREHAGLSLDLLQWNQARESAQTLLAHFRKKRRKPDIAVATNLLGLAAKGENDWAQARKHFDGARELFDAENDEIGLANIHNNLGLVEYLDKAGDKTAAAAHLQKALRLRRNARDRRAVAEAHINLGALAQQSGLLQKARRHYVVALKIETHLQHVFGVGRALCNLGEISEEQGNVDRALRLYVASRALFEEIGVAYQNYTTQKLATLSGETGMSLQEIQTRARELARAGDLEELANCALA